MSNELRVRRLARRAQVRSYLRVPMPSSTSQFREGATERPKIAVEDKASWYANRRRHPGPPCLGAVDFREQSEDILCVSGDFPHSRR